MDQLLAMRVFLAAVDGGSLAAAARQLDLSPAMAGRYVTTLEEHLSARLLQRTTRQLSLTEAGERYAGRARRILAELEDADREVADRDRLLQGTLRISAPVTFGAMHLGPSIASYRESHPRVRLDMVLSDRHVDLLDAGIDVAIRVGHLTDENLTVRRLAACRLVACASPGYLAAHGAPASPAALASHACLAFKGAVSAGDWTFLGPDGTKHVYAGGFALLVDNMDMLRAVATAGGGIVFGPAFAFSEALAHGSLVEVLGGYATTPLPIHAVFPTARYIPRMVREFVDRLAEDFEGVPPWERPAA